MSEEDGYAVKYKSIPTPDGGASIRIDYPQTLDSMFVIHMRNEKWALSTKDMLKLSNGILYMLAEMSDG